MVGTQVLRTLRLTGFRNFERADLSLTPSVNVFTGDNAQGKTNLLDAVQLLCGVRPGRISLEEDLILFGRKDAGIEAEAETGNGVLRVGVRLHRGGRRKIEINGKPQTREQRQSGLLRQVFFSPEDVGRPSGSSAGRRRMLDELLIQISPRYSEAWGKYRDILVQRNRLLDDIQRGAATEKELDPWDALLLEWGAPVMEERTAVSAELSDAARKIYRDIAGRRDPEKEALSLRYERSWERTGGKGPGSASADFSRKIRELRSEDVRRGQTTVGPHRDDLSFWMGSKPMKTFGSRGQHRSAVLAVTLASWEAIERRTGSPPFLLLDDALSELDGPRREALAELVSRGSQAFVTAVTAEGGLECFSSGRNSGGSVFEVRAGTVAPRNGFGRGHGRKA